MYPVNTPYRDGTTHFVFEPIELLARLAALVPRPRGNLVRYHGILAPNAKHRSAVVPNPSKRTRRRRTAGHARVPVLGRDRQDDSAAPTAPMTADCIAISTPFAARTDLDGAAAQSIQLIASQSAFRSLCERTRLICRSAGNGSLTLAQRAG